MRKDNVVAIKNPEPVDELTQLLREGAQKLLCQAVQVELDQFLMEHRDSVDVQGRQQVVRNGYLPAREVLTGVGPVRVQVPKTRDRAGTGACFRSSLLPPYIKRSQSVDNVLPWLYLKGISTGDFGESLEALLGPNAAGLSAGTICRLKSR